MDREAELDSLEIEMDLEADLDYQQKYLKLELDLDNWGVWVDLDDQTLVDLEVDLEDLGQS